ncbi:GGDEF domain-containing protein [Vogesella facilis]|uniref:GGDEF domain-containing protein n=1 Tax=Vogesella facilis TaxID=1655232 RepID=A0ABV7RGC5_9NEIS
MERILTQLTSSLNTARTIDQLIRPVLEMLSTITGMESTYLTSIDLQHSTQHVRFARNCGQMTIPEGLTVPWGDTLCKRALDMGRPSTNEVLALWGDSDAARQLGIQTYVSAPILNGEGALLGTLCAASAAKQNIPSNIDALFQLFANIVANFIEREMLVEKLQVANDQLAAYALTDALTGLPNRRAMFEELERLLAQAERSQSSVLVGVIDLDGFKQINDSFGHQAGDDFLKAVSQRLQASLRSSDRLGRLGGDEFLFIGPGPALDEQDAGSATITSGEAGKVAATLQQRLTSATIGPYTLAGDTVPYAGASVGVVAVPAAAQSPDAAIQLADVEMYVVKRARKAP